MKTNYGITGSEKKKLLMFGLLGIFGGIFLSTTKEIIVDTLFSGVSTLHLWLGSLAGLIIVYYIFDMS